MDRIQAACVSSASASWLFPLREYSDNYWSDVSVVCGLEYAPIGLYDEVYQRFEKRDCTRPYPEVLVCKSSPQLNVCRVDSNSGRWIELGSSQDPNRNDRSDKEKGHWGCVK